MNNNYSVAFGSEKLLKEFEALKEGKHEEKQLFEFISRAIDDLKQDPLCGTKVPKKVWPKSYVKPYMITNLWKYNLPNAWRIVYTIKQDEITLISFILEWFSHKEYERRFGYGKT